jgi:hypothetical protein
LLGKFWQDIIFKAKSLATYFRKSNLAATALKNAQFFVGIPVLQVATRSSNTMELSLLPS